MSVLWHFFSPWQIVLQSRSGVPVPTDVATTVVEPAHEAEDVKEPVVLKKKDDIEQQFGALEQAYLKNARTPYHKALRSRHDSIKLIYSIKKEADWQDLIDSHDSDVSALS